MSLTRGRSSTGPQHSSPPPANQLDRVAIAAVALGTLGPRLAKLSEEMAAQAREQAARAKAVADGMQQLTLQLDGATGNLRGSAGQVERALTTVRRIAEQTRILAINASIEAARAGEHGKAFGVVVEEVQQLALGTGATTDEIEQRMHEMHGNIARVAAMTGSGEPAAASTSTVAYASAEVQGMAASASHQLASADSLKAMGTDVKRATDALLLSVGRFRFAVHARASDEVAALVTALSALPLTKERVEPEMERWLSAHRHFELVYLTDGRGRQITDNLASKEGRVKREVGLGKSWSDRPWFRDAADSTSPTSTDLYLSSATGELCFTVSAALRDESGAVEGVVGADVNFQQILSR
jgi:methyl-accepting chemotaxis protein